MVTYLSMLEKLIFLYGEEKGKETANKLEKIINEAKVKIDCEDRLFWDEKDVFLITYADSFRDMDSRFRGNDRRSSNNRRNGNDNNGTLKTLSKFLDVHLKNVLNGVHILPFYPYSSDRGFSIIDYYQVKKEFGTWGDIEEISKKYRLMADLVLNHVSIKHDWFQRFLAGDPKYENYFIWFEEDKIPWDDLKKVIRSRVTPLVTPFETKKGRRFVWTTYSVGNFTDQVDLNYQNPEVLLEILKVILNLLEKGVRIFRLDGVSGIWKQLGTTCRHLPQTHTILKLFREIMNEVCPSAFIITETTTASFAENISYFGNNQDEAQVVYNFPLAPLILQAFYSRSSKHLTDWQRNMTQLSPKNSLFNILDIHDGINIHAVKSLLSDSEVQSIFKEVGEHGGQFSYRTGPDGQKTVKEMHVTWWSAINRKDDEPFDLQLRKFLTSRAIAMSIRGIPAIYYLSLFGRENDIAACEKTKHGRDINRTNLSFSEISEALSNRQSRDAKVFHSLLDLINLRKQFKAFHPNARQEVLSLDERIFAVLRGEGDERILALHNVSGEKVDVKFEEKNFSLEPYGFIWVEV